MAVSGKQIARYPVVACYRPPSSSSPRPTLLLVVSFVFRGRAAPFHPFFVFLPIVHLSSSSSNEVTDPFDRIWIERTSNRSFRSRSTRSTRCSRSRDVVFATNRKNPLFVCVRVCVCIAYRIFYRSKEIRKYRRIGILGGKEWANLVKRSV